MSFSKTCFRWCSLAPLNSTMNRVKRGYSKPSQSGRPFQATRESRPVPAESSSRCAALIGCAVAYLIQHETVVSKARFLATSMKKAPISGTGAVLLEPSVPPVGCSGVWSSNHPRFLPRRIRRCRKTVRRSRRREGTCVDLDGCPWCCSTGEAAPPMQRWPRRRFL